MIFRSCVMFSHPLCDEVTTKETGASKDGCNVSTHCTSSGDTITNDRFARGQSGNISQTTLYKFHTHTTRMNK